MADTAAVDAALRAGLAVIPRPPAPAPCTAPCTARVPEPHRGILGLTQAASSTTPRAVPQRAAADFHAAVAALRAEARSAVTTPHRPPWRATGLRRPSFGPVWREEAAPDAAAVLRAQQCAAQKLAKAEAEARVAAARQHAAEQNGRVRAFERRIAAADPYAVRTLRRGLSGMGAEGPAVASVVREAKVRAGLPAAGETDRARRRRLLCDHLVNGAVRPHNRRLLTPATRSIAQTLPQYRGPRGNAYAWCADTTVAEKAGVAALGRSVSSDSSGNDGDAW